MPFDIEDYVEVISNVVKGGFKVTPRMRLYAGIISFSLSLFPISNLSLYTYSEKL